MIQNYQNENHSYHQPAVALLACVAELKYITGVRSRNLTSSFAIEYRTLHKSPDPYRAWEQPRAEEPSPVSC